MAKNKIFVLILSVLSLLFIFLSYFLYNQNQKLTQENSKIKGISDELKVENKNLTQQAEKQQRQNEGGSMAPGRLRALGSRHCHRDTLRIRRRQLRTSGGGASNGTAAGVGPSVRRACAAGPPGTDRGGRQR